MVMGEYSAPTTGNFRDDLAAMAATASEASSVVPSSSATLNRTTKLDVVSHGVETCNLDAMNYGVDPRVQS
jgi:hypothetical protein